MYRVKIEILEQKESEESNSDYRNRTGHVYDYTEKGGPKLNIISEPCTVGKGEVTAHFLSAALNKAEAFLGIHEEVKASARIENA